MVLMYLHTLIVRLDSIGLSSYMASVTSTDEHLFSGAFAWLLVTS